MKTKQLKSSHKGVWCFWLPICLICLLASAVWLPGTSFSRYVSGAGAGDSARVAAGGVTVHWDDATTVEMDRNAADDVEIRYYHFSVSGNDSEVAVGYDLTVTLDQPLPDGVTVTLYKNGDAVPISTIASDSGTQMHVADAGAFEAGSQEEDRYELVFAGDYGQIWEKHSRKIRVSVQSAQID